MTALAFTRTGDGAPLVLLHGIGCSRRIWDPVIPSLAAHFDVLSVDLPGFGDSGPTPPEVEPLPAALAATVASFLDDLGISAPHVVGNSLGGWVALELAGIRPVSSVTLLSPAGLWRGGTPVYCRASLQISRWLARHAGSFLCRLANHRLGRVVILGQTHARPAGMTPGRAQAVIQDMGTCSGFEAALKATFPRRYLSGPPIDSPVTVAFGSRDLLLRRRQSRHLDELPPGTVVETLPNCGHIPMSDNPDAVTALIVTSTARGLPG